jgi:hypothetical protein
MEKGAACICECESESQLTANLVIGKELLFEPGKTRKIIQVDISSLNDPVHA